MVVQGVLLFLFIPLVLFLFLRQPLGPAWSVLLGVAIMFGHRFVAAPWAAKFADVRCVWCGRLGGADGHVSAQAKPARRSGEAAKVGRLRHEMDIISGGRTWHMQACSEAHADHVARFLLFVDRFRVPIAAGIFLPLAWLLVASLSAAASHPLLPHAINALIFRVVVASIVVLVSLAYLIPAQARPSSRKALRRPGRLAPPEGRLAPPSGSGAGLLGGASLRCPFPIHNLSLLGIGNTLWVFRVVGLWWIVEAIARLR